MYNMTTFHILIRGKVQMVFFRHSMKQKADELNITGWVKNMPNGQVEALLQGEEKNINKLLEWCKHGPSAARVDDVQTTEIKKELLPTFTIR